jgi:hypothetical protein
LPPTLRARVRHVDERRAGPSGRTT